MESKKQPKWKRILPTVLWTLAGIGLFVLLVSASSRNSHLRCAGLEISIEGYKNEMFISEADIKALIEDDLSHTVKGCAINNMNLRRLENLLQKDNWVSKAQLFIDNQQKLHVAISERLPVARIFTQGGRSYYIDSQAVILPLSQQQIADVPVFTNLLDRPQKLAGADSLFWQQIGKMGNYIISDSFLLMQIGQVAVTPEKELEIYPIIGNHIVLFGKPEKCLEKLTRLKNFDKQILAKAGLNKYSRLDLRYDKQIVATIRGKEELPAHQTNIRQDIETAVTTPFPTPAPTVETAKAEMKAPEKKQVSVERKEAPKKEIAKKEIKKPDRKPEKLVAKNVQQKTDEKNKKILAAANNKTNKIALKRLSENVKKMGIIEVDIRKKSDTKKSSPPQAVMPKKQ